MRRDLHDRDTFDVVVCGAGPAGALAAFELARADARVLLVEKSAFPRAKVCGSCINPRAVDTLQARGLGALLTRERAEPLEHLVVRAGGQRYETALDGGVALTRERLDVALVSAAMDAGARFLSRTTLSLAPGMQDAAYENLELRGPRSRTRVRARLVLDAGGLGGGLRRRSNPAPRSGSRPAVRIGAGIVLAGGTAGASAFAPGTVHMACGRSGYVGLVRAEHGRTVLAAALDPAAVKLSSPQAVARDIWHRSGMSANESLFADSWRGTPVLRRAPKELVHGRVLRLGDSAGYVEPFTGEGIAWALDSAVAIAPLCLRGLERWDARVATAWRETHAELVAGRQGICKLTAGLLRWPALVTGLVALLGRAPRLSEPLARRVLAHLHRPALERSA